jgi:hypothetical protein
VISDRGSVLARIADRGRLTLPLLVPSLAGLAYLARFDAPPRLIGVNAGALLLGLGWVLLVRLPSGPKARLGLAAAALAGLFLPPLLRLDVEGVARWLPLGPFLLHSGGLLMPLLVVIAAKAARFGPWLLAFAALALGLQPDAGTLAALAAASAVIAWTQRSTGFALVAGGSLTLAAATWSAGMLPPQAFTEGVLAQVWQSSPVLAAGLAGMLFVAPGALMVQAAKVDAAQGAALAALITGLAAAATLAPFPYPLIGYGAAPILGFALALGAMVREDQSAATGPSEVVDRTP